MTFPLKEMTKSLQLHLKIERKKYVFILREKITENCGCLK